MAKNTSGIKQHEFKKGQSGNPKGRPPVIPLIKEMIEKIIGEEGIDDILQALIARAKKGDVLAAREILDRYYGKAKQNVDVTSNGDSIIMPVIKIERK